MTMLSLLRRHALCTNTWRSYATTTSSASGAVELAFDRHPAPETGSTNSQSLAPLVILHGLLGSKQNWRSLSRSLAQRTGRDVYALDLRNHGTSPHNTNTTYKEVAGDVDAFLHSQKLKDIILVGHSMGGKVAMAQALAAPNAITKLVVVDISPARARLTSEFAQYIEGMQEVEKAKLASKKEADQILQKYEKSLPIRQFLLTNLQRVSSDKPFEFRVPLDILGAALLDIGDFPYGENDGVTFQKPTLFIKGGDSKYVNKKNFPVAEQLFPNSRLITLDGAGHWVHSEKPKEFVDIVTEFCQS